MKFLRRLAAVLLLLAIVAGGAAVLTILPFGPGSETFVDIVPGTGTPGIAAQLKAAGIIRSQYAFEVLRWFRGGSLKAGEYRFDHPARLTEVYARLQKGDVYTRTLLIPEGYNIFDIALAVEAAGLGRRDDFLEAAKKHTELVSKWNPDAPSLEGYLFPDTYRFSRHSNPVTMLSIMVKRFGQTATQLGLTRKDTAQAVVLASIVEKEVHIDSERPVVAGVFENRLAAGMPLQTDPTVIYASLLRGTWTGVIHQSELHSDSEYNTYTHTGLPPGPICNPGVAALRAAMHPAQTEFMYFVADANGATRFSSTFKQHLGNVADYRKHQSMNQK